MESWFPSSDDESEELEAIAIKLEAMRRGNERRKKRSRAWYEEDETEKDNDESNDEDEDKVHCYPIKCTELSNNHEQCDDSDASAVDLIRQLSGRLQVPADEEEQEEDDQVYTASMKSVENRQDYKQHDESVESSIDPTRPPLKDIRAPPASPSSLHDSQSFASSGEKLEELQEDQDSFCEDFESNSFILDDSMLEQALAKAEAQTLHQSAQVSPVVDTNKKNTTSPELCLNEDEYFSSPLFSNGKSTVHSPSVLEWFPKEQDVPDDVYRFELEDKVTPMEQPHKEAQSPTGEKEPLPSSKQDSDENDDDWVQELLHEQERHVRGELQAEIPVQDTLLRAEIVSFDHVSRAFGFSPSPIKARLAKAQNKDDELLEIPTRDDAPTNEGIECDERYLEVDPSHYPLPSNDGRPQPLVHHFTLESHPPVTRHRFPVVSVFKQSQIAKFFHLKFEKFNSMQSELTNTLAHSDDHLVVAARKSEEGHSAVEFVDSQHFHLSCITMFSCCRFSSWR